MQNIDLNLLRELTAVRDTPCISIYMPRHKIRTDSINDALTFKNIYKKVQQYIEDMNLGDHKKLLTALSQLLEDSSFWNNADDGLAILVSGNATHILRLPEKVNEIIHIGDSYYVKPLFKIYQENQEYYVLALNLDNVALYRGNRYQLEEIPVEGKIPKSMKEALGHELTDNHLHASVVIGAGLHGYMEKSQEENIDTERFFRKVDRCLYEHFPIPKDTPLVLAALPEHHTLFRKITKTHNLSTVPIPINPLALDRNGLLEKVSEVLKTKWNTRKDDLLKRYNLAISDQKTSANIADAVRDGIDGKIEVLCIEDGRHIEGSIDVDNRKINPSKTNSDLLNSLAIMVMDFGGHVVVLPQEDMPNESGFFTIARY